MGASGSAAGTCWEWAGESFVVTRATVASLPASSPSSDTTAGMGASTVAAFPASTAALALASALALAIRSLTLDFVAGAAAATGLVGFSTSPELASSSSRLPACSAEVVSATSVVSASARLARGNVESLALGCGGATVAEVLRVGATEAVAAAAVAVAVLGRIVGVMVGFFRFFHSGTASCGSSTGAVFGGRLLDLCIIDGTEPTVGAFLLFARSLAFEAQRSWLEALSGVYFLIFGVAVSFRFSSFSR